MAHIEELRGAMARRGIDCYIVPTDDFHGSEYVGDHFRCREYVSGFTGSAGTLAVTRDFAGLWTDGRYFLQAAEQLAGTGITLMKENTEGVPTLAEFLEDYRAKYAGECEKTDSDEAGEERAGRLPVLGFDGRCVSVAALKEYLGEEPYAAGWRLKTDGDFVGEIWPDRPPLSAEKAWLLPDETAGFGTAVKLAQLRADVERIGGAGAGIVISSLDDVAWLLNMRGNDVACTPVVLAYLVADAENAVLFTDISKFDDDARAKLESSGVSFRPYDDVCEYVENLRGPVIIDPKKTNCELASRVGAKTEGAEIIYAENPAAIRKAVKSDAEIANIRRICIEDCAAVARAIYRIQRLAGRVRREVDGARRAVSDTFITEEGGHLLDEADVHRIITEERAKNPRYIEPSFGTIAGYAANGAIVHYEPKPEACAFLKAEGLLLIDTGGQYMGGTTDMTRTIALGPVSFGMREVYTAVLSGHIDLAMMEFPKGTRGSSLDAVARAPVRALGIDYAHGTGHGVGYMLSCHEGPQSIRAKRTEGEPPLEPGHVVSDEPGAYIEGEFGVRIENIVLVIEKEPKKIMPWMPGYDPELDGHQKTTREKNLGFETLEYLPYERELILPYMLTDRELEYINEYHRKTFELLAPLMENNEQRAWLAERTYRIERGRVPL